MITTQPNWQPLASDIVVPARPSGLWTRVVDYVAGPRKLKIVAKPGVTWTLSAGVAPGPDGDLAGITDPATATSLFPAALRGALIGKIGGSAADNTTPIGIPGALTHPATVPTPFPVGSFCVVEIAGDKRGPLFLTMNDAPSTFDQHVGQMVVNIFCAL
jgi:hypothetical protein